MGSQILGARAGVTGAINNGLLFFSLVTNSMDWAFDGLWNNELFIVVRAGYQKGGFIACLLGSCV